MKNTIKIGIWIACIIGVFIFYQFNQELFSITFLEEFVADNKVLVMAIYVAILSVLGILFIPSTPFAIGGVLLFSPWEAYILNIIGIMTSSTIVYYFAQFLGIDDVFDSRYPKQIKKIKKALHQKELPIITGWSFIPVVPTDLMIYVASGLRIPLWKCWLGVSIGEGTLNLLYLFSAYNILQA